MKTSCSLILLISVLALVCFQNAKSQNYQTANKSHDSYYKTTYPVWTYQLEENIQVVKIDSVAYFPSGDSVFYFNRQMQDTSDIFGECNLDMTAPGWLGTHVYIRPDGENKYFNRKGDTISIKTQAGLGDSWIFSRQTDSYFQATLESIEFSPVAGTNDSVKVISLQAYSNSGTPIADWFNQKKFRFSKNHGFTELYSLYNFPADTNRFELSEYEPLSIGSVYDFSIGDIFHFENGSYLAGPPQYKVITILSKWLSATNDTIYYRQREKNYINTLVWDPDPHVIHTTKTDTVTVWYANPDSLLSEKMPHQQINPSVWSLGYYVLSTQSNKWNNRPTITFDYSMTHMFDSDLNCYIAAFEPTYTYSSYTKGCGASYYFHEEPADFSGFYNKLVYFKKGNEIWGDPYILNATNELPGNELFFEVFPNPFSDRIEIQIELKTPGTPILSLYSMSGLLLLRIADTQKQPGTFTYHPDLSGLAKGIYILKYSSGENSGYKKLIRN